MSDSKSDQPNIVRTLDLSGYKHIVQEDAYCAGKPRIKDTRIPIFAINFVQTSEGRESIKNGWPTLTDEQLDEVQRFLLEFGEEAVWYRVVDETFSGFKN